MFRQSTFKTIAIAMTLFLGTYLTLPTVLGPDTMKRIADVLPGFLVPSKSVKLGLDLQGGVHVMLEADRAGLTRDLVKQLQEDVRRVLRTERVAPTGGIVAQQRGVSLRITDAAQRAKVFPKLQELATPVTNAVIGATGQKSLEVVDLGDGLIQLAVTDAELNERLRRATDQSLEIFRKRIDPDGVKEPSIQRQGLERIVVQVPGAKNSKEITDVLQPGKLEFRMVAEPGAAPNEIETMQHLDEGGGTIQVERRVLVQGEDPAADDCHEDHKDTGQETAHGKSVSPDVQSHFAEGGGNQHQGKNSQQRVEDLQDQTGSELLMTHDIGCCQYRQVDGRNSAQFEKPAAGIFRIYFPSLRPLAYKCGKEIRDLAADKYDV